MLHSIVEMGDFIAGYFNYEVDLNEKGTYYFLLKHLHNDMQIEVRVEAKGNFNEYGIFVKEKGYWFIVVDYDEWRETKNGLDTKYKVRELLNHQPSSELFFYKAIEELKKILIIKEDILVLEFKRKDIANLFYKLAYTDKYSDIDLISYFYGNKKIFQARITQDEKLDLSNHNCPKDNVMLSSCTFLRKLSLANNSLEYLPYGIHDLIKLQHLDISDNLLRGFPWEITNLPNLEILQMHNSLGYGDEIKISEEISKLKHLKELDIKQKFLDFLPETIGELEKLSILKIEGTDIFSFPDSFYDLENLEELHLINNRFLKDISSEISKFNNLRYLYLYGNNIKFLPDSFGELVNLRTLHLGSNNIKSLPPSFSMLENLEKLVIDDNKLSELPDDIFELPNLRSIDVTGNLNLDTDNIIKILIEKRKMDLIELIF